MIEGSITPQRYHPLYHNQANEMRNILPSATLAILAPFLLFSQASAQAPVLTYGNGNVIELAENAANQRIDFFVSNVASSGFDTFELFIMIGDGGQVIGGSDTGPVITDVELGNSDSIFEGGNQAPPNATTQTPLLWFDLIDNVEVTSDGLVGTLVLDSTGFFEGTEIDIRFEGIVVDGNTFDSFFTDTQQENAVPVSAASNGIIRIVAAVPEPASTVVILAVAGIMGVRRRR